MTISDQTIPVVGQIQLLNAAIAISYTKQFGYS